MGPHKSKEYPLFSCFLWFQKGIYMDTNIRRVSFCRWGQSHPLVILKIFVFVIKCIISHRLPSVIPATRKKIFLQSQSGQKEQHHALRSRSQCEMKVWYLCSTAERSDSAHCENQNGTQQLWFSYDKFILNAKSLRVGLSNCAIYPSKKTWTTFTWACYSFALQFWGEGEPLKLLEQINTVRCLEHFL